MTDWEIAEKKILSLFVPVGEDAEKGLVIYKVAGKDDKTGEGGIVYRMRRAALNAYLYPGDFALPDPIYWDKGFLATMDKNKNPVYVLAGHVSSADKEKLFLEMVAEEVQNTAYYDYMSRIVYTMTAESTNIVYRHSDTGKESIAKLYRCPAVMIEKLFAKAGVTDAQDIKDWIDLLCEQVIRKGTWMYQWESDLEPFDALQLLIGDTINEKLKESLLLEKIREVPGLEERIRELKKDDMPEP